MPRPRLPLGSHGRITVDELAPGVYRARTYYRHNDGRRRQVERRARTRAAAEHALKTAIADMNVTASPDFEQGMTLAKLADAFLIDCEATSKAPGSIRNYAATLNAHVRPRIGELTLAEVTPARMQAFIATVPGEGAANNTRRVLSAMFGLATRNGAMRSNPMRDVRRAKDKTARGDDHIPLSDVGAFVGKLRANERLRAFDLVDLLELLLYTGMRAGEACGLHGEDIDLASGTLAVRAQTERIKGQGVVRKSILKTDASSRTLKLSDPATALLKRRNITTGRVFTTHSGGYWDSDSVGKQLRAERDALGYPELTTHAMRRTVATFLNAQGLTARDVADYLGHENPSVTQDVYMRRDRTSSRAADALGGLIESTE